MNILVIEDDRRVADFLERGLRAEGHVVHVARNGPDGLALAQRAHRERQSADPPTVLLLDVMLPGLSGLEVCQSLRAARVGMPILMLTARDEPVDKVVGLELGADDYVTKPFSLRELLARCKAMLRRRTRDESAAVEQFSLGDLRVDLAAFTATRGTESIALSKKEAAMLALLKKQNGRAVSRAVFLREVWGGDQFVGDRTIDTHMLNLRAKIERDPKNPTHLLTVHGVGYRLVDAH